MDEETLELVRKYPDLIYKFETAYRQRLARLYISKLDTSMMNKTQETATLYNAIKAFGATRTQSILKVHLGVDMSTVSRRLHMAREAGLIKTKEK